MHLWTSFGTRLLANSMDYVDQRKLEAKKQSLKELRLTEQSLTIKNTIKTIGENVKPYPISRYHFVAFVKHLL